MAIEQAILVKICHRGCNPIWIEDDVVYAMSEFNGCRFPKW